MSKSKVAAAVIAAASMSIVNPYSDLPETRYLGSVASRKLALTKSQVKNRAKAKSARKARKKNR